MSDASTKSLEEIEAALREMGQKIGDAFGDAINKHGASIALTGIAQAVVTACVSMAMMSDAYCPHQLFSKVMGSAAGSLDRVTQQMGDRHPQADEQFAEPVIDPSKKYDA